LGERHPKPPLFPRDPARRAELEVFPGWFNEVWKLTPNAIEGERVDERPATLAALCTICVQNLERVIELWTPEGGVRTMKR
jgi:glutathione S-transferase